MKQRVAITLTATAATMWPSFAFAQEGTGAEPGASWFVLIFYAINFLIFLLIVKRYGGESITGFFRNRARSIRETIDKADVALRDAEALSAKAVQSISTLEADKTRIANELADETVIEISRIYDAAQEAVARIKRDTEVTSTAIREAAQRRIRETMAEAAGQIAREILTRNFQPSDQKALLRGFVEKLTEEARP
jgi:F-type H+-transporting ATPase subunit b